MERSVDEADRSGAADAADERTAPRRLAGGNPHIPKGEGEAPVQAYIAAAPGWKQEIARELGTPLTCVRASSFLENYAYALPIAASTGRFDTFLAPTDRTVAMVASADIGAEVARRLVASTTGIVELGSRFSPDDLARAMADVLGRPVAAHAIPRERWSAVLEAQGFPRGGTWAFEEMEDGVNSGWIDFGVPGAEVVPATITPPVFFRGSASP